MGVLDSCNNYQDYLEILKDYIDIKNEYDIERINYLYSFNDEKTRERVIRVFKKIDSVKGESNNQRNLMRSRKNSFLAVGLLFGKFANEIEKLTTGELAILAKGLYSDEHHANIELDEMMIKIVTDKRILRAVIELNERTKKTSIFEEADILFKIKCHFLKRKINVNDENARESFINEILLRIQNGTLDDGVPNLTDYLNRLLEDEDRLERRAI